MNYLSPLYRLLFICAAALAMAACTDEPVVCVNPGTGSGGDDSDIGDRFSITFNLPLPENYSSTREYTGTDRGTFNEVLINNVCIVLYGSDEFVAYKQSLDINLGLNGSNIEVTGADALSWYTSDERIFIQTKAQSIPEAAYKMLIIVNGNNKINSITAPEINELSDLETFNPTDTNTPLYNGTYDNSPAYFLMLNSQDLIEIKTENFFDTKERAENNPVYASVERAAAKVESTIQGLKITTRSTSVAPLGRFVMFLDPNNQAVAPWEDDYDIPEDQLHPDGLTACKVPGCTGTYNKETHICSLNANHTYDGLGLVSDAVRYMVATDLSWQVDITNKKQYWYRHLANKAGNTTMEQQGDNDRKNFYAEDPNFKYNATAVLTDEFNYLTYTPGSTYLKMKPPLLDTKTYPYTGYWSWSDADVDHVYVPENTMEQNEQRGEVVTRVIYKAVLKRELYDGNVVKESFDPNDPTEAKPTPIGDFFVFKGGDTDIEDYKYNNYNKDGSTFFILRPEDVAIYAAAVKAESFDENNVHPYLRAGLKAAINEFISDHRTFDFTDMDNEDAAVSDNLSFYKDGEMFYAVPIEHFSKKEAGGTEEAGTGAYGRFGVVRNNWYKLNVNNLISIGQPIIPPRSADLIEEVPSGSGGGGDGGTRSAAGNDTQVRSQSIIF